jgi:hypothetical protein
LQEAATTTSVPPEDGIVVDFSQHKNQLSRSHQPIEVEKETVWAPKLVLPVEYLKANSPGWSSGRGVFVVINPGFNGKERD